MSIHPRWSSWSWRFCRCRGHGRWGNTDTLMKPGTDCKEDIKVYWRKLDREADNHGLGDNDKHQNSFSSSGEQVFLPLLETLGSTLTKHCNMRSLSILILFILHRRLCFWDKEIEQYPKIRSLEWHWGDYHAIGSSRSETERSTCKHYVRRSTFT